MSRNTVTSLLAQSEPPAYEREARGSLVDPFDDAIAAMLVEDPKVPATVILERLRPLGYVGGISILKERVAAVRPSFAAARAYQRTSYLPGEVGQFDWWHTGRQVPVGEGATREAFGLVARLPHSAAHACVFTLARTTADFCPALLSCLERLGGVPREAVFDNDPAVVASRSGGIIRLQDEVAALLGRLGLKAVVLRPRHPEAKGQAERTIGYLETSFLPLRHFADLEDLQHQHDSWARTVAFQRRPRRLAGTVADAWRVERAFFSGLPKQRPSTDTHVEARVSQGRVRSSGAGRLLRPTGVGRSAGGGDDLTDPDRAPPSIPATAR